jgi:hypothetical protein
LEKREEEDQRYVHLDNTPRREGEEEKGERRMGVHMAIIFTCGNAASSE